MSSPAAQTPITELPTLIHRPPLEFTPAQRQLIRNAFANGATDEEFAVLMEVAKARNLNPLMRQVHFVKRYDRARNAEVWATQVSIDGLRALAERTGLYKGQSEPEYGYAKGDEAQRQPIWAKVRVFRKGWTHPAVGVAHWAEYVQTKKDGSLVYMWEKYKHIMIAKCSEALALRKAFPEDAAGLYTPEELALEDDAESKAKKATVVQDPDAGLSPEEAESKARKLVDACVEAIRSMPSAEQPARDAVLEVLKGAFPMVRKVLGTAEERSLRALYKDRLAKFGAPKAE